LKSHYFCCFNLAFPNIFQFCNKHIAKQAAITQPKITKTQTFLAFKLLPRSMMPDREFVQPRLNMHAKEFCARSQCKAGLFHNPKLKRCKKRHLLWNNSVLLLLLSFQTCCIPVTPGITIANHPKFRTANGSKF